MTNECKTILDVQIRETNDIILFIEQRARMQIDDAMEDHQGNNAETIAQKLETADELHHVVRILRKRILDKIRNMRCT